MKKQIFFYALMSILIIPISCTINKKDTSMIEKTLYGKLPDGREVYQFTLKNKAGATMKVINYGAIVTSMTVPDRSGKYEDVILGYDSLDAYIKDNTFFGSVVGRYGNRIGKGKFKLEGKEYQLALNDGPNHLHGGKVGYNKVLWTAKEVQDTTGPAIELTYISADGEEGYPGTVTLSVVYTLTENNEFKAEYKGTTDKTTVLNPTQHSYFNLSGSFNNTILDHVISINADAMTPVDNTLIPIGKLLDVTNTPMDLRNPTVIGAHINDDFEQLKIAGGYDHNWVLNNYDKKVRAVAEVYEPKSGRLMTVLTDQPGVQFYSGNFLDGTRKGKGVTYQKRSGLCLEAQCYPDTPNKPEFPSCTLKPGEEYRQTTIYQFSTK
ncbi:MAG: galactose mutarotase [Bacteroidetes bacterium]|nr:galactose mutarotase [Bacteroidota bacterium]